MDECSCSGVNSVSNSTGALFKLLGLKDGDGNGKVEKLTLRNLGKFSSEKGYKKEYDPGNKGYVTEDDIRHYLLNVKKLSQEELESIIASSKKTAHPVLPEPSEDNFCSYYCDAKEHYNSGAAYIKLEKLDNARNELITSTILYGKVLFDQKDVFSHDDKDRIKKPGAQAYYILAMVNDKTAHLLAKFNSKKDSLANDPLHYSIEFKNYSILGIETAKSFDPKVEQEADTLIIEALKNIK